MFGQPNNTGFGGYPTTTAGGFYPSVDSNQVDRIQKQLAQIQQQMQQMQQATMQSQQPMQQPVVNNGSGALWVNGEQEALVYPVAPNSSVVLWDNNAPDDAPVVYLKQADATGKTSTQIFDLVERKAPTRTPPQVPAVSYVPRDEFDALAARVEALAARRTSKVKETVKEDAE